MMYYPNDLYEQAMEHQQQLRTEAQRDRLARQAAAGPDATERAEKMLSRSAAILKTQGRIHPAPAGNGRAAALPPGHPCLRLNGAKHPH
jgi:hypothetical protein